MIALWLTACAWKATISSVPASSQVKLPTGDVVATPAEVTLRWAPWSHQVVVANAPGYRTLTVDLRKDEIRLGRLIATSLFRPKTVFAGAPRGEVRLYLVPDHGPAGSRAEAP